MKTIHWVVQILVCLAVAGLVANYFAHNYVGYGYSIHPYVYYGVAVAALIIPVFWALTNLCGGILFGLAAGGFLDGVKLGFMLGMGFALGKLWPYALACAVGVFAGNGPRMYIYVLIAVGALLFALDRALHYFWKSTAAGHEGNN